MKKLIVLLFSLFASCGLAAAQTPNVFPLAPKITTLNWNIDSAIITLYMPGRPNGIGSGHSFKISPDSLFKTAIRLAGNATYWSLSGNSGTNTVSNFLGTTDDKPLMLRLNNTWYGKLNIDSNLVFLGQLAGYLNTGFNNINALGWQAAEFNSGFNVNALGNQAAAGNTGTDVNALGFEAANNNTGSHVEAWGNSAAQGNSYNKVVAIGDFAEPTDSNQFFLSDSLHNFHAKLNGGANGTVLTNDGSGNGTWQSGGGSACYTPPQAQVLFGNGAGTCSTSNFRLTWFPTSFQSTNISGSDSCILSNTYQGTFSTVTDASGNQTLFSSNTDTDNSWVYLKKSTGFLTGIQFHDSGLYLVNNNHLAQWKAQWPRTDGDSNAVLSTNSHGILGWEDGTISGVYLGQYLHNLFPSNYILGNSYNGGSDVSWSIDTIRDNLMGLPTYFYVDSLVASSAGGSGPYDTLTIPLLPKYGGTGQDNSSSTGVAQWISGSYSVLTTLANGTLANTQAIGDNTAAVATDAFVETIDTATAVTLPLTAARATGKVTLSCPTCLTGNQTITLSGDVTGSGATAITTAIKSSVALAGSPTTTTQTPLTNNTTISTTAYTDAAVAAAVQGVNPAVAVQAATTTVLPAVTCANGVSGIGATLTQNSAAILIIDGYTPILGDRLLIKNQATASQNGIYIITTLGTSLIPFVLTRAADFNSTSDINSTGAIPVINGTINGTTQWVVSSTITSVACSGAGTSITFTQFSANPANNITTSTSAGGDLTGTYPNPTIKASVGLTGSPTTTTQTIGDNSTKVATTAYVDGSGSGRLYYNAWDTTGAVTQGTWGITGLDANELIGQFGNVATAAQNDACNYKTTTCAGTYNFAIQMATTTNRGIITVKIDGSSVGTIDLYSASLAYNVKKSIYGIVLTSGIHTVQFIAATKNASSGGYLVVYSCWSLTRVH